MIYRFRGVAVKQFPLNHYYDSSAQECAANSQRNNEQLSDNRPISYGHIYALERKLDQLLSGMDRDDVYIDKKGVSKLLGVSIRTVDRMRKEGIIPKPKTIPLGSGTNGRGRKILRWKREEVVDFIDQY